MDCEFCARRIIKRKPFLIVALAKKHRLGYTAIDHELAFCSRECVIRAMEEVTPYVLDRVSEGKHLPEFTTGGDKPFHKVIRLRTQIADPIRTRQAAGME